MADCVICARKQVIRISPGEKERHPPLETNHVRTSIRGATSVAHPSYALYSHTPLLHTHLNLANELVQRVDPELKVR